MALFQRQTSTTGPRPPIDLYLNLIKGCLTRSLFPDLSLRKDLITTDPLQPSLREEGKDWPTQAETMIGWKRLNNIQECVTTVIRENVPGDLVETGVWRGGASIFMRAVLAAHDVTNRKVWVADSFEGLPAPDPMLYPQDAGDTHHSLAPYLAVTLEQVQLNFQRYGLLDDQVQFLKGWFKDTLREARRSSEFLSSGSMEICMNRQWKLWWRSTTK